MKKERNLRIKNLLQSLLIVVMFIRCASVFRGTPPDLSQMSTNELRDRIERNHLAFNTLSGKGKIMAQMADQAQEASVDIKIIMPDSLYLKVEAIFGIDVGTFSCNRSKFALYSPMQKVLYTGLLDSLELSKFFQVDITYEELLEAVIGTPKIQPGKMAPLKIQNNQYLLTSTTDAGVHQYWIHPEQFVVNKYQFFDREGALQIVKEFSRFEKYGSVYLPRVIQIHKPTASQVFAFYYDHRQLNKAIDKRIFKIKVPPQTRHIRL